MDWHFWNVTSDTNETDITSSGTTFGATRTLYLRALQVRVRALLMMTLNFLALRVTAVAAAASAVSY